MASIILQRRVDLPQDARPTRAAADPPRTVAPAAAAPVVPDRAPAGESPRPRAEGKFLFVGGRKLFVRGVTYGPFCPGPAGEYHDPESVDRDFARMAAAGFNAVRTYTVPPRWLLDAAQAHGLYVMIGLPWEQHVAFLDRRDRRRDIERRVREGVRACAGHPAVLCYAIGNEIPAPVVRWYGHRRVERFLNQLYCAVKAEDSTALVTYVNYPSTEYLHLPFVDLVCVNVYLEAPDRLAAYLARLQNIAGERPLMMAEIGLDSLGHGEDGQARGLAQQVRGVFAAGCAGAFVFSWTDEWHRGGHDIDGWRFGLTTRDRAPKPALAAVRDVLSDLPFPAGSIAWPSVSVVVCTYNGSRTIADTLDGLAAVDYPGVEVIVVNDGSTDATPDIVRRYPVRLINTENHGLSHARNVGLRAARGQIVAYLDDDARPDIHWLRYLAERFVHTTHAGIGGPNLTPPDDGPISQCVGNAPGGPTHVLLTDELAEHIPGCNMAFRRECLEAVGGFDERFRIAGDDVDLCWRIQDRGWTLGYSPAAVVWHHRRPSVRAYWKQQLNYGRAEAMLERKWPQKYNAAGHPTWAGRLYNSGGAGYLPLLFWSRRRIYHGVWGNALFQSVYHTPPGLLSSLPLMPEWMLLVLVLFVASLIGLAWPPLLLAAPLFALAAAASVAQAVYGASRARFARGRAATNEGGHRWSGTKLRALTAALHLVQPVARLLGRAESGLTPWRRRGAGGLAVPRPRRFEIWSETWRGSDERLAALERAMGAAGAVVLRGGACDRWDLEVRGGMLGSARLSLFIEEHGDGKQLVRVRAWPHMTWARIAGLLPLLALGAAASAGHRFAAAALVAAAAVGVLGLAAREAAGAMAALVRPLRDGVKP